MKKLKTIFKLFVVLFVFFILIVEIKKYYEEMLETVQETMATQIQSVRLEERGHGRGYTEVMQFTESAKELHNPEQGFYYIHGFLITDKKTDYCQNVAQRFCKDEGSGLALIQINLQNYKDEEISEAGLANIERLFQALEMLDKQLIIRFLYDWNGDNKAIEPDDLNLILEHMRQVGPIVNAHKDKIFTLQGLFIGNWGEMNGTQYLEEEELQVLAGTLAESTDEDIYLAVRMPMFYRKITHMTEPEHVVPWNKSLPSRLGLYNDGMLGNWSDYGTYGDHTKEKDGLYTYWNREEELAFQEILCQNVPNGGEVIVDNEYNDLESAISDFNRMHITYLNKEYDKEVLNKWAEGTVSEEGCFDGMDGLTYIERHLGYRLFIKEAALDYSVEKDVLTAKISLRNVGFAPLYYEKDAYVHAVYEKSGKIESYKLNGDIRELAGGTDAEEVLTLQQEILLHGEAADSIILYFEIKDPKTGDMIELANEQKPEAYGYHIGRIKLETVEEYKNYLGLQ